MEGTVLENIKNLKIDKFFHEENVVPGLQSQKNLEEEFLDAPPILFGPFSLQF